jgi:amidohydrolase
MSAPLLAAYDEVMALVADLWAHPEVGYHETYSSARVREFLTAHVPGAEITTFARTGLRVRLGPGHDRAVALVAELDALIVPAHPDADPVTGAVHACGHHTQVGIACAVVAELARAPWDLPYDLVVVFVPAEEYIDLDTRRALRDAGEIAWFGGKPEAMRLGVFDDVDVAVLTHTMGGGYATPTVELDCDLAGFAYKHVTFHGRAAHAGFVPFAGVNAASMAVLYQTAIGLGRQQLREDVLARLNPVVSSPPMTTNVIPDTARVSTDVRTIDLSYMAQLSATLDAMAAGAALALGGVAEVDTEVGYLPFRQHRPLSEPFRQAFVAGVPGIDDLLDDRGGSAAAGDVGDLSVMLPCIQIGYSGLEGTVHGADLHLDDPVTVLDAVPRFVLEGLRRLGPCLAEVATYRRTYEEYEAQVTRLGGTVVQSGVETVQDLAQG